MFDMIWFVMMRCGISLFLPIGIDDKKITSELDLFRALDSYKVGDFVDIFVIRSQRMADGSLRKGSGILQYDQLTACTF